MSDIIIKVAKGLENLAYKLKRTVQQKELKKFLRKYNLQDGRMKSKMDVRYNPYEGTSISLMKTLVDSGEISKNDIILDVGCGVGLFLIYLAENGFINLRGIEIDPELYELCIQNILRYREYDRKCGSNIEILNGNAIEKEIDENINCFYLFNTFYDQETYLSWLSLVENSLKENPRTVKIILLYPTVASMGAMRKCTWLKEKKRILCESQVCYRCVNYLVYESV